MSKKYSIATAVLALTLSTVCADGQDMSNKDNVKDKDKLCGGFVTGFSFNTLSSPFFKGGLFNLGYYGEWALVDVGVSYNRLFKQNFTDVIGHLGMRARAYKNLFATFGAVGEGFFHSHGENNHEWGVGAFAGLDYQLNEHFLLSGKVYPYNYKHKSNHQVFSNASISFFYVY